MSTDFDTNDSMNPDLEDLLQEDEDGIIVVPVRTVGAQRTHELPARVAYSRSINVSASNNPALMESLAPEDPRRKYLIVTCTGFPVWIGHDKQMVADGVAGILPIGAMLTLATSAPVWVRSTGAGPAVVSYWTGNWAD